MTKSLHGKSPVEELNRAFVEFSIRDELFYWVTPLASLTLR